MSGFWRTVALYSLACIVAFFGYLYYHLGLQKPVEITQSRRGPMWLLYKAHRGAYHEIAPVIQEVELWATGHNVPCPKTFGEYLDDPSAVDQDRLRSHGGCVVPFQVTSDLPDGLEQREMSEAEFITAQFSGSPAAGPLKVYPAVRKYAEEHRIRLAGPVFEFYLLHDGTVATEYLFVLP